MTAEDPTAEDYAALLAVGAHAEADHRAFWEAAADGYHRARRHDDGVLADGVVAHLVARGILTDARVLDIGAGTGRYALRIARHAGGVHLADVSDRMLAHARADAEAAGLTGLGYTRVDWTTADLDALGWRGAFDVVFASMVPVVRSRAGIDRMTAASRAWCVVNRTIRRHDTLARHLERELGLPGRYDPGNDRAYPRALVNYLWLQGRLPTVAYVEHRTTTACSVDEAAQRYARAFTSVDGGRAAPEHGDLREVIRRVATGDEVVAEHHEVTAVISWPARAEPPS
ncbi:hypothetical protein BJF78_13555 [Pseudonocardia sp. CNS-139]|nr:hypothetical protein BJF78_13555 [Pseudonocardia sp. CNS-139]